MRRGEQTDDAPIFTNRHGRPLTGTAIRRLFDRLKGDTNATAEKLANIVGDIVTATHTREELDRALEAFRRVGKRLGLV